MSKITAATRLRPIRFGFLVRPTSLSKLKNVFAINTCLWGGKYNPIIPYFDKIPIWWERHKSHQVSAKRIINGYLEFFEPDFIVETEKGLAQNLGISTGATLQLEDLLRIESKDIRQNRWGLNTFELYKGLYQEEFKFVRRHEFDIVNITSLKQKYSPFSAALFGIFPQEKNLYYIERAYMEALGAKHLSLNAQTLIELYKKPISTPLDVGSRKIDVTHSWSYDPILFILDATKPQDLIDYWNLRIIERNVWAIPIQWIDDLDRFCKDFIDKNYVPLPGNPHGVMITTTLQFSRSISEKQVNELYEKYLKIDKAGAASIRSWYPHIWEPPIDLISSPRRPLLDAGINEEMIELSNENRTIVCNHLSPDFVEKHGLNDHRWANVIQLSDSGLKNEIATTVPTNLNIEGFYNGNSFDPIRTSSEGLILFPSHKNISNYIDVKSGTKIFIEWLKCQGIQTEVSHAGKTTAQLIKALGGLKGVDYISHPKIIDLLNDMAHKQVKVILKGDNSVKEYPSKAAEVTRWEKVIHETKRDKYWKTSNLEKLNELNVLKVGINVKCKYCKHFTWYALSNVDYELVCEECLSLFPFPQIDIHNQAKWFYRTQGVFTLPDYAQGAYTTALSLRFFGLMVGDNILGSQNTWSTSLDKVVKRKDGNVELADFCLWFQRSRHAILQKPQLVWGESKSFGNESFEQKDITNMKDLAIQFPGSFLVFATMKETLSSKEIKLLSSLAKWGRKYNFIIGERRAHVIILTGTELFAEHSLAETWRNKGGQHAELIKHPSVQLDNLTVLSDFTQQLYLELPSYFQRG